MTPEPKCRCTGDGTYTVSIPIADAVVSIERECPVHGEPSTPLRDLAVDTKSNRLGEVMQEPADKTYWGQYLLRPVGGGQEWPVQPRDIQLVDVPREA